MEQTAEVTSGSQRGRGRPRCENVRQRVLEAALDLLERTSYDHITVDGLAERAGASKATLYRWWPNKAAILIEAFRELVAPELPFPNTGSLREDIRQQLQNFTRMLTSRRGRMLASFIAGAQGDQEIRDALRGCWILPRRQEAKIALERNRERGELRPEVDLDFLLDMLYGPLYYRLLLGGEPLTPEYAEALANQVVDGLQK